MIVLQYLSMWLISFIKLLMLFLMFTVVMATVTLVESKVLSLVQSRVGPQYVGYKGRLQFIADAVKFLVKHILIVNKTNSLFFLLMPALTLVVSYLFWMNLVWGPNLMVCEIEYNLFLTGMMSLIFSTLLMLVGWVSNNKYAILASTSMVVTTLNLEMLLNFLTIFMLMVSESLSFMQMASTQAYYNWNVFMYLPLFPMLVMTFLLETGSMPFDLAEAESELVAGFTTEYGGFFFALFYLGEYFHLYCFSTVYTIMLFGAWVKGEFYIFFL